jgi:hypothetical protein
MLEKRCCVLVRMLAYRMRPRAISAEPKNVMGEMLASAVFKGNG